MFFFYIVFVLLIFGLVFVDKYECWEVLIIVLSIVLGISLYLICVDNCGIKIIK